MKKKLKKKWLAALRSGQYRKVEGLLREEASTRGPCGYCALGVLHEISSEDPKRWMGHIAFVDGIRKDSNGVAVHYGIDDVTSTEIIDLNDNEVKGTTFVEVADWIEKNVEGT